MNVRINWICHKGFIWNPSNFECECNKWCDIGEKLDYKNCICRKELVDSLVEKWGENIRRNKTIFNTFLNDYEKLCCSCTIYIYYY